ncbi:MAG: Crp/Fnr family transcriptional regulator [Siphonobacter sp.]
MLSEINQYLATIQTICPELNEQTLGSFREGLTVLTLRKKDFYIQTGDLQKKAGFVVKGLIRAFYSDPSGNEKTVYFIPENEYAFHYASFVTHKPSPLSFQCLEETTIVQFSPEQLKKAYEQIPKFETYGRLIVEEKLRLQQERLEGFLFGSSEQRYLDFVSQYSQLFNRITLTDLCSYLGVERQTLTRIRKKLQAHKF